MISYREAKELMIAESPVLLHGVFYRKIVGIIFRKGRDEFVLYAELLDESTNSVTQARLSQIEKTVNDQILKTSWNDSELIFWGYECIDELERMISSCYMGSYDQMKQGYNRALKKLIILDKGICDAGKGRLVGDCKGEDEMLRERSELFNEDDPETKDRLNDFIEKEDLK